MGAEALAPHLPAPPPPLCPLLRARQGGDRPSTLVPWAATPSSFLWKSWWPHAPAPSHLSLALSQVG